ncbi:MAG: hypothetical protein HDR12_15395 [Lachnospiraceae bacterium]|nr:hypothetical protein [Lachnospiraceae bacterium]
MDIIIREIESKDYLSVAAIWRDVLGFLSVTDENAIETYEKMKTDNRYCTFVADVNGVVVGFATTAETLAIGYPNGYIKMNGLASGFQRTGAHKFYERLGYTKTSFWFRKSIENS